MELVNKYIWNPLSDIRDFVNVTFLHYNTSQNGAAMIALYVGIFCASSLCFIANRKIFCDTVTQFYL